MQPLIAPLFEGLTELELLARLAGLEPNSAYEIVRETFRAATGGGEEDWKRFLFNGFQAGSAAKPVEVALAWAAVNGALQAAKPGGDEGQSGGGVPSPLLRGRWPLQQQRLAAGVARADHQGDLGQPDPAQSQDLRASWGW